MEDALQLGAATRELELIGKSSRIMSNFFSVRIVNRILNVMTAYFVTVLKLALLESVGVVLQYLVTMDLPVQLTPVMKLLIRATMYKRHAMNQAKVGYALNLQGYVN